VDSFDVSLFLCSKSAVTHKESTWPVSFHRCFSTRFIADGFGVTTGRDVVDCDRELMTDADVVEVVTETELDVGVTCGGDCT